MRILLFLLIFIYAGIKSFAQDSNFKNANDSIPWSYQVDTPPQFPEGESAFIFYIGRYSIIPDSIKCRISKIYLSFVVNEKGKINNIEVKIPDSRITCTNDYSSTIAKNAFIEKLLSGLKRASDWIPAKKGNKNVAVRMSFPINIEM